MKRTTLNFILELVSFINLLGLAFIGFIMKYVLPPGSSGYGRGYRGGRGPSDGIKDFLSITRHEWVDIHFYLACLFVILILVHLILHWNWIKGYFKSLFSISHKGT